jgi:hypothetical protein
MAPRSTNVETRYSAEFRHIEGGQGPAERERRGGDNHVVGRYELAGGGKVRPKARMNSRCMDVEVLDREDPQNVLYECFALWSTRCIGPVHTVQEL